MDCQGIPRHIAVIMDGNGRWAKKRFKNRIYGHEVGVESVREIIRCALKWNIPYLTLYAFSKENWARPSTEINALWQLLVRFVDTDLPELVKNGVRVVHIGDREGLPENVLKAIDRAMAETAHCDKLLVQVALNYGGRQEIVRAVRLISEKVKEGQLDPKDISLELFETFLFSKGIPDPDLVIRTSGEYRISNFLLWQIAYSEIYVTEVHWPEFREEEFVKALGSYKSRERRFGKTSEQIREEKHLCTLI